MKCMNCGVTNIEPGHIRSIKAIGYDVGGRLDHNGTPEFVCLDCFEFLIDPDRIEKEVLEWITVKCDACGGYSNYDTMIGEFPDRPETKAECVLFCAKCDKIWSDKDE